MSKPKIRELNEPGIITLSGERSCSVFLNCVHIYKDVSSRLEVVLLL